jgi:hypothetical protein
MLKSYCHSCSSRGVPYLTTSPHGLIPPPIKQVKTLVKFIVVTVILVKFIILIILVRSISRHLWLTAVALHPLVDPVVLQEYH